jgi:hypothetical protein
LFKTACIYIETDAPAVFTSALFVVVYCDQLTAVAAQVVRTTVEALAAILGGAQSLHTNSYDEAVALPTEDSASLARATQLILAEEAGLTQVADPLGGSFYVEALTARMEAEAARVIEEVRRGRRGGRRASWTPRSAGRWPGACPRTPGPALCRVA